MLKQILIIAIASAMLLLSGCGAKPKATMLKINTENPSAEIKIDNGTGVPSWAANESKAFKNVLEASAKFTLQKGYKYFAIISPNEIANTNGSLRNTAKELLEHCTPNSSLVMNIPGVKGLHKCGTYNTKAILRISMFNKEQEEFTVINAQKVLDFYKENDLLSDEDIEIIK